MKKATLLFMVMALALMTVPALALNNIVLNGDFQNAPNHLQYWTQVDNLLHDPFTVANTGANYYARAMSWGPLIESSMYQIVDASTSDGWLADGTSESFDFKFDYRRPSDLGIVAASEYGLFYSSAAVAPAFGSLDAPGAGWTPISVVNTEPGLPPTSTFKTVEITGTLPDQPRWFAIAFEGRGIDCLIFADFDNVSLTTQCVPLPPSALLMCSGLLGLGLVGWRRRIVD